MNAYLPSAITLWLIVIAVMDLRMRKVRNWMVLLGLATGLIVLFSDVQPLKVDTLNGLTGMLVAFAALLPFYALRWMGAGDVKFAAVIGLWFGLTSDLLLIWVGGSLLAGVHGLSVVFWRGLQASPLGAWLQVQLPPPFNAAFATPHSTSGAALSSAVKPAIQRSIPYAGYMALVAIGMLLSSGPLLITK